MKAGQNGKWCELAKLRTLRLAFAVPLLLCLLAGCAGFRHHVKDNLMADNKSQERNQGVAELYRVGCPDVLRVQVNNRPDYCGDFPVAPDGRIALANQEPIRVEGKPAVEVAALVAQQLGLSVRDVDVDVAEFNSQYLLLFGQVIGWQRSLPYRGQETVLDVLQRVGGITPGAAPEHVYVVRAHVSDGQRPEVFHVDLKKIVLEKDHKTNIRVLPYDQIYVGETRRSRLEKSIPLWFMPVYRALNGEASASPPTGEAGRRLGAWGTYMRRGEQIPAPRNASF